jgi:hypothetical protein
LENLIALLLLVVPGFISHFIYECLNEDKKIQNEAHSIVVALTYSIFVMLLNYLFIIIFKMAKVNQINNIALLFSSIPFVCKYILITLMSCIIIAYAWNWLFLGYLWVINKLRKIQNKNELLLIDTVFHTVFQDGKQHAVSIEIDKQEYGKGFVGCVSPADGRTKELYLVDQSVITENEELFDIVKGVYIDLESKIRITEYDLGKYHIRKKELENEDKN